MATHLSGGRVGPPQDGDRDEPTCQPETDARCDQSGKVPDVLRRAIVDHRREPVRGIRRFWEAIPDDKISGRDPVARPSSERAKVREGGPVQGYTGGEVRGGDRGNRGCVEIPGGPSITSDRIDEIRNSGEGVDDGVYLFDNRDEGEEGTGS